MIMWTMHISIGWTLDRDEKGEVYPDGRGSWKIEYDSRVGRGFTEIEEFFCAFTIDPEVWTMLMNTAFADRLPCTELEHKLRLFLIDHVNTKMGEEWKQEDLVDSQKMYIARELYQ